MSNPVKVNSGALPIQNPLRFHGGILLGFSGALCVLALLCILLVLLSKPLRADTVVAWLAVSAGLYHAGQLLFDGLRARLVLILPAPVPADLAGGRAVVEQVLFHKALPFSNREPGPFELLVQSLLHGSRDLPPPARHLIESLLHRAWPLPLAVALLIVVAMHALGPLVLPLVLLVMVLVALGAQLGAIIRLPSWQPRLEVSEAKVGPIDDVGSPEAMHHANEAATRDVEAAGFPNRLIQDRYDVGPESAGSVRGFDANLVFETQPLPVGAGERTVQSGRFLTVAAIPLTLLGWGMMFVLPVFGTFSAEALALITGVSGVLLGEHLLRLAQRLQLSFQFASDVYWIRLHGTYSESTIGLHHGGGKFGTQKQAVQSQIFLELRATRLLSECSCFSANGQLAVAPGRRAGTVAVLSGPRYPIAALARDELFLARLRSLLQRITSFSDQSRRLATPLLTGDLQQLVALDVQVAQAQNKPILLPVAVPAPKLPAAPPPSPPGGILAAPTLPTGPRPAGCPQCGASAPGPPGNRYCINCDLAF